MSIPEYLVFSLGLNYSSKITEDDLRELLGKEKTLLLFDGLDEIFNIKDKIGVKQDIENFRVDFPHVKSITTSRYTGYDEVRFDEKKFCEISVLPFDENQIKEYVHKWYLNEEEDDNTRNSEISGFVSTMGKLEKELISNPLLLSLIVILYRNNLRIPDSRFEIYRCCTDTLVDKWDTDRQILIEIDSEILSKKESIFADLAYWQYKILSSDNPVINHDRVLAEVAESLVRKKVADDDNNEGKAKKFLEYAQKRSIYFDNRFYHKTFLEYFTAYWIYSNCDKKYKTEERNKIIKEYCVREFWFIVLELLLNCIDNGQPDTEVIDGIIEDNSNNLSSLSFLLHVLPVLKNISEKTQILVYTKTIDHILSLKANEHKRSDSGGEKKRLLFSKILNNASTLKQKEIIEKAAVNFPNQNISFYVLIDELAKWRYFNFDFNEIRNTSEYQEALEKDPHLFYVSNYNNDSFEKMLNFINLFGVDLFCKDFKYWFAEDYMFPYFNVYLIDQFEPDNINSLFINLETLEKHSLFKIRFLNGTYFLSVQ